MVSLATLQALASGFSATRVGPELVQPGQPVRVRLTPSAVDVRTTDLVPGELTLTWIIKNVRFEGHGIVPAFAASPFDPTALDGILLGGMPARVPVVGNVIGTQELAGVPGQLAQLAGTIPIPMEVPVSVAVNWTVRDEASNVLAAGPGTFSAPQGTTAAEVSFVFAPQTVELTTATTTPTARRFIRASVTLTAGSTNYAFDLPDIPVVIPAIPIPTVVVFFLHTSFTAGAAFIVVPNDSPLKTIGQLQSTLNTLQGTIGSLTSIAELAAFLLGLQELSNALAAQPHIQFRVANSSNRYNNFNNVTLIQRPWYQNDTEAEDELSSMIVIGPERKTVRCFNDRDVDDEEGAFTLQIGPKLHALVRDLHSAAPASGPDGGELTVDVTPPGGWFNPDNFGDNLSSLRFP